MLESEAAMKRPHILPRWREMRSLDVQVVIELIAGGMVTAVLMRWLM